MKRVYESPVMMLEGFEANEYVAACWDIVCLGCTEAPDTAHGKPKGDLAHKADGLLETVKSENEPTFSTYNVTCTGGPNFDVPSYYFKGREHYSVVANPTTNLKHPNASV